MSFHVRYFPENVKRLEDKLAKEGSHNFYQFYIKDVDSWAGTDKTKDSEKFIKAFVDKYMKESNEFYEVDWQNHE
jgi:nitrogen regulatory protein PII-like uncharacterized protein